MTTLRQAAQQALEAMDNLHRTGDTQVFDLCHKETTEALRAALAEPVQEPVQEHAEQMAKLGWQYFECPACGSEGARAFPKPVQEPVGWIHGDEFGDACHWAGGSMPPAGTKLYTAPPQRKPLTDEEIDYWIGSNSTKKALARAIEVAHGIKEQT